MKFFYFYSFYFFYQDDVGNRFLTKDWILVKKDVQADTTISIDVGMEHIGEELHNRGLVGVFLTELHGQFEGSILRNMWYKNIVSNLSVLISLFTSKCVSWGPKMTALKSMMLFSPGAPLTPAGGSSWSLLKSHMRRLRAEEFMVGGGGSWGPSPGNISWMKDHCELPSDGWKVIN